MRRTTRVVGGTVVLVAAVVLLVAAIGLRSGSAPDQSPSGTAASTPNEPTPGSGSPTSNATTGGPGLLLPNMRSLDASDLQIEQDGAVRRLRFSASLANVGAGPLLVEPLQSNRCATNYRGAEQLLFADRDGDGRFQRGRSEVAERRFAGCMLDHPTHDHWHFDAMAAYSLRRPGEEQPLVSRDKVSFCLRDNAKVAGQPVVVPKEYYGDCTRNGPQGISPGWVDIYTYDLDGQWLRLPASVRTGSLCLALEADPLRLLRESDETDNATAIGIEISGTTVRRADDVACQP